MGVTFRNLTPTLILPLKGGENINANDLLKKKLS
jgi:hypothetical protein